MNPNHLPIKRVRQLLDAASKIRILVIGDAMLDHFIWGTVSRISPEAPVPVVDFERESFMPGGAANVARNLTALRVPGELFAAVGRDAHATQLRRLLGEHKISGDGLLAMSSRPTSVKTRIVAHKQQVVRIDRETRVGLTSAESERLLKIFFSKVGTADAVILGDYGKGVVTQSLLNQVKEFCRSHGLDSSVADPSAR